MSASQEVGPYQERNHTGTLILDFPASGTLRSKFLLFKPPKLESLLWQPKVRQGSRRGQLNNEVNNGVHCGKNIKVI